MEKMINVTSDNYFFRMYETISYDKTNPKKPYVCTNVVKRRGKEVAGSFNVSAKVLAENLKETPGLFFALPHEVFEQYFSKTVVDSLFGEKTDLEVFLDSVKEGMLSHVDKIEGSLTEISKSVDEFQEKILEKVDFEKQNLKERTLAKQKIKDISLNA